MNATHIIAFLLGGIATFCSLAAWACCKVSSDCGEHHELRKEGGDD